jgi:DNA-binding NtrC family response regulator
MSASQRRQRILIIGEKPLARDDMRILSGSAGCECAVASNAEQALAAMKQKKFDAVVLDPPSSSSQAAEVISRINEFYPDLRKNVVIITDENGDSDSGIKDLAARYSIACVQRKFLLQQLLGSLEALFRPEAVFQDVTHLARLISDSFRDPLPAGLRGLHDRSRRLVYAAGSLRVDLLIEPQAGCNRLALAGQILDSAKPDRRFDGVPVTLHGWKGSMAQATTEEFGEFHLDFNFESNIILEVRIAETNWITVPLPVMERARRNAAGLS